MRFQIVVVLLIGWSAIFQNIKAEAGNLDDFQDFSAAFLPGRLYVPPEAGDRPLILFLHGAGNVGDDNVSQIVAGGIDNLIDAAKQRGAFLYAPQAIEGNWHDPDRTSAIMAMIDQAIAEQDVDTSRIYVTGLSLGGGGTWNMMNRFSDRFAAAVPIAGVGPSGDFDAANFIGKPVWPFHARNDTVVRAIISRSVVNHILTASGEVTPTYPSLRDPTTIFEYVNDSIPLNYTEWPTGGHGIWHQVYSMNEMHDWMFSQAIAVPEPSAALLLIVMVANAAFYLRRRDEIRGRL